MFPPRPRTNFTSVLVVLDAKFVMWAPKPVLVAIPGTVEVMSIMSMSVLIDTKFHSSGDSKQVSRINSTTQVIVIREMNLLGQYEFWVNLEPKFSKFVSARALFPENTISVKRMNESFKKQIKRKEKHTQNWNVLLPLHSLACLFFLPHCAPSQELTFIGTHFQVKYRTGIAIFANLISRGVKKMNWRLSCSDAMLNNKCKLILRLTASYENKENRLNKNTHIQISSLSVESGSSHFKRFRFWKSEGVWKVRHRKLVFHHESLSGHHQSQSRRPSPDHALSNPSFKV
jgi:hypothetical protein